MKHFVDYINEQENPMNEGIVGDAARGIGSLAKNAAEKVLDLISGGLEGLGSLTKQGIEALLNKEDREYHRKYGKKAIIYKHRDNPNVPVIDNDDFSKKAPDRNNISNTEKDKYNRLRLRTAKELQDNIKTIKLLNDKHQVIEGSNIHMILRKYIVDNVETDPYWTINTVRIAVFSLASYYIGSSDQIRTKYWNLYYNIFKTGFLTKSIEEYIKKYKDKPVN